MVIKLNIFCRGGEGPNSESCCESSNKISTMNIQQMLQQMRGGGAAAPAPDQPLPDTAEKIQISSLSLLKMLKHG